MATVSFDRGDMFTYPEGHGVVLPDGEAYVIEGPGGRGGYTNRKMRLPAEAVPIGASDLEKLKFEVALVLKAVKTATA